MHRNPTLIGLLTLAPATVLAQPTLTFPDNAPTPGNSYSVKYGPYQPAGSTGAGQTWDFGDLSTDSTSTVHVEAPNSVPGGAGFPNATAAVVAPDGTQILEANTTGLFLLGGELFGQSAPFTDPAQHLAYPCTFQTSWEDAYGGTADFAGLPIELQGQVIGIADGYGTLALPEAVVTDVLRVHRTDVLGIVTFLGTFELTTELVQFYKAGIGIPVLEISSLSGDLLGEPLLVQTLRWVDMSVVSVNELESRAIQFTVYPNPASDMVQVAFDLGDHALASIELMDLSGRAVRSFNGIGAGLGKQLLYLPVGDLATGSYFLRITNSQGAQGVRPLQIQ